MLGNGNKFGNVNNENGITANGVFGLTEQIDLQREGQWPVIDVFSNGTRNSLDVFGWTGTASSACNLSKDFGIEDTPVKGVPLKMVITGNDPHTSSFNSSTWNLAPAENGQTWETRVWVKGSVETTGELFVFGANSSGIIGSAGTSFNSGSITIGTSWSLVKYSFTFNDANVAFVQTRLDGTPQGGAGNIIWWDGLQVHRIA